MFVCLFVCLFFPLFSCLFTCLFTSQSKRTAPRSCPNRLSRQNIAVYRHFTVHDSLGFGLHDSTLTWTPRNCVDPHAGIKLLSTAETHLVSHPSLHVSLSMLILLLLWPLALFCLDLVPWLPALHVAVSFASFAYWRLFPILLNCPPQPYTPFG